MTRLLAAALAAALLCAGCEEDDALPTFEVRSLAFGDGETIPERHTCDGDDLSPPLVFEGAPEETAGYAIVMYEAGEGGEGAAARWSVWGIPAEPGTVAEGIPVGVSPGGGLSQGRNALDVFGYSGPCPTEKPEAEQSDTRRYVFYVYALSAPLDLEPGVSIPHVLTALSERAIARGHLVGVY
jgi:Raf kinase inhibitor-like YbhB/YbcL family protein